MVLIPGLGRVENKVAFQKYFPSFEDRSFHYASMIYGNHTIPEVYPHDCWSNYNIVVMNLIDR